MTVTVVDYGSGNLHSVLNALRQLEVEATVAERGEDVEGAGRLLLPGVGAFADAMYELAERGHVDAIRRHAEAGRPLMGVCLGMQLLFDRSEEFGPVDGLGILGGDVRRLDGGAPVPHIGWAQVEPAGDGWAGTPLAAAPPGLWAYFAHSFHVAARSPEVVVGVCDHGGRPVAAAVAHQQVFGVQFHPEKSGAVGLRLLEAFCRTG